MVQSALFDRVKMSVTGTPGTGTITLGSAVTGFRSFAGASVPDGSLVSYLIEDGNNYEIGQGTYASGAGTLARTTIEASSSSGAAITATSAALVSLTALAVDVKKPWHWAPPAAATFSADLNDGTAISLSDDIDVGMIIYSAFSLPNGDRIRAKAVTVSPAGDWSIQFHMTSNLPIHNTNNVALFLYKAGQVNVGLVGLHTNSPSFDSGCYITVNRYSQSGTGFTDTLYTTPWTRGDAFFKVTYTSATDTLQFYISSNGKTWINLGTVIATTWLGGAVDTIGFGIGANNSDTVDWQQLGGVVDQMIRVGI